VKKLRLTAASRRNTLAFAVQMRIGIVSYWFNRGQGTIGRYIRSIFDALGYETFVLARPTKDRFDLPRFIDKTDVWDQPKVTFASTFNIPKEEYVSWAKDNSIDVAFLDQNYQFEGIAALKRMGIKTIGRFVWEAFAEEHVKAAKDAFSVIYSLTKCEQARYASFGIESPWVQWGCHPELTSIRARKFTDGVYFFYPGGYLSNRKPTKTLIKAFTKLSLPDIRLVIKAQRKKNHSELIGDVKTIDPRIKIVAEDLPSQQYYKLFSSCHVCLAPSRWEGLGLHLYEALSFGMPTITNDDPPMNEIIRNQYNGLLVSSHQIGHTKSGLPSHEPDADDLSSAIGALSEHGMIDQLSQNTKEVRKNLSWEKTTHHFKNLLSW
jgi:1,2-diacylglycerol 3-alpha-glucosyltransferase